MDPPNPKRNELIVLPTVQWWKPDVRRRSIRPQTAALAALHIDPSLPRTDHRAHELWCGNMSFPAIVYNDTGFRSGAGRRSDRRGKFALSGPTLRTVDLEARNWKDEERKVRVGTSVTDAGRTMFFIVFHVFHFFLCVCCSFFCKLQSVHR